MLEKIYPMRRYIMDERYEKALEAAKYIRSRINASPEIGVVL